MDNITNDTPQVGDFISIPAWRLEGQVIATEPAWYGPDGACRVLVEAKPDDPKPRWYHLEPGQFTIVC